MLSKKSLFLLLILGVAPMALAAENSCANILPQVSLQLTAEQWVTTQTADVSIALDALLTKANLEKAQDNFQAALKRIAPDGAWHISEFTLTSSKADLEQLHAVGEARIPTSAVASLRARAKAESSEGETYSVQNISYTPSTDEISAAQAKLRAQIYQQAKDELSRLNAVYPTPGYSLYTINFGGYLSQPNPEANYMVKANFAGRASESPTPAFSQQLIQNAAVIFAAPPGVLCSGH